MNRCWNVQNIYLKTWCVGKELAGLFPYAVTVLILVMQKLMKANFSPSFQMFGPCFGGILWRGKDGCWKECSEWGGGETPFPTDLVKWGYPTHSPVTNRNRGYEVSLQAAAGNSSLFASIFLFFSFKKRGLFFKKENDLEARIYLRGLVFLKKQEVQDLLFWGKCLWFQCCLFRIFLKRAEEGEKDASKWWGPFPLFLEGSILFPLQTFLPLAPPTIRD